MSDKNPPELTNDLFNSAIVSARLEALDGGRFQNPLISRGADPFTTYFNGHYYYTQTAPTMDYVGLRTGRNLTQLASSPEVVIWRAKSDGPASGEVWAPEIHCFNDKWYIYFSAADGDTKNHRMFVLESVTDDPLGEYLEPAMVTGPDADKWAIDGTVLDHNGKRYFIWSGWEAYEDGMQNLYIAPLITPSTIGDRICISTPKFDWEFGYNQNLGINIGVNEGPAVLRRDDKVFIVYSANGSWTDNYQLGMLSLVGDDPLQPSSWHKSERSVFTSVTYDSETIHAPGHCSFVKTACQTEDWILFHAAVGPGSGWNREVHTKPFHWEDGRPVFGTAPSRSQVLSFPSNGSGFSDPTPENSKSA